jgi:Putative peptidoglycan binding domain
MRNLILATASVLALGLSAGAGHAQIGWGCGYGFPCNPSLAQVQQAQQMLRAQGLYHGPIDETGSIALNAKTEQAIQQYQREHDLSPTGKLDQSTMASLRENTGLAGSSTPPNSNRAMKNPNAGSVTGTETLAD